MTTLVIGARGSVGRHVLEQLRAAGEPVRASVRDLASADFPPDVPVVAADLTRPTTLGPALDGVRRVFLYATPEGSARFADAARRAGVEHVVLMSSGSVLLPWAVKNAITAEHRAVEDTMAGSGLSWTPIRPLVLASNALNWADSIRERGEVALVYPESVTAPVHERDIAAVAVAALLGTAGRQVRDLLTGGELLTDRRQVELIGEVTGRSIGIRQITPAQARELFGGGEDPEVVDAILEFMANGAVGGSPATTTAADVLGRPPATFGQWVRDHAEEFQPNP